MGTLIVFTLVTLGLLTARPRRINDGWPGFRPPTRKPLVSSGWGASREYRATAANPRPTHYGLDFSASIGTPIYSVGDGVVTFINSLFNSHAGLWVRVKHKDGLTSEYLHLSEIHVKPGDSVNNDTVLGLSGDTGASGPGSHVPHLHLTMRADPAGLKMYKARFNMPASSDPSSNRAGLAVPGEPIIPARYTAEVQRASASRGVSAVRMIS